MPRSEAVKAMLAGYEPILRRFVNGELSANRFESEYLKYFKSDTKQVASKEFDTLDELFANVDDYVKDPQLRAATGGIGEKELRRCAEKAYDLLYSSE
ncbi:colicin immunity domain-containing protein [[Mycobacterium] fortunisiensis]|nr:colicin immunity domain-containing protein [[Mycobacterium] fortunisiensis]